MNPFKHFIANMRRAKVSKEASLGPSPHALWKWLLFISLFLLLISAASGLYLFFQISQGDIFQVENSNRSSLGGLDQKKLRSTLDFYEAKAKMLEDLKAHPHDIIDPSI